MIEFPKDLELGPLYYREALVHEALKLVDNKSSGYRGSNKGLTPEEGFDCSGFVTFLLKRIGYPLEDGIRHCNEYFDRFGIFVHLGLQQKGDLVFFSGKELKGVAPTHMGVMISSQEYIHSQGTYSGRILVEGLKIEEIPPETGRIYATNPIGFKRLTVDNGRWKKI